MQVKEIEQRIANSEYKTLLNQLLTHMGDIKLEVYKEVPAESSIDTPSYLANADELLVPSSITKKT